MMNNVIEHIEYLVRRHDCVVIPSLGAFIAHYQPARYDDIASLFYPPSRDVSFNISVDHNDGLLISSISRRKQISFARASKIVEEEVAEMKSCLEREGAISLGNVGRFIRQEESTLIFEPSVSIVDFETSCLSAISAEPLIQETAEDGARKAEKIAVKPKRRFMPIVAKAAAAVAVAVSIGVALMMPTLFTREGDQYASLSPSTKVVVTEHASKPAVAETSSDVEIEEISDAEKPASINDNAEFPDNENAGTFATVEEAAVVVPVSEVKEASAKTPRYCLVVASLASLRQAERYIAEVGDDSLDVFVVDGKYRVYAAAGNTFEELASLKSSTQIGERYPDAWVCRMK